MRTDTNLLGKGLKQLGILIFLFILSPVLLTISFKALNKFTESPKILIAYGLIVVSFLLILFTIYFAIKTFKLLLDALFLNGNDK